MINAKEHALKKSRSNRFVLRDASTGYAATKREGISAKFINQTIDQLREQSTATLAVIQRYGQKTL